MKTFYSHNDEPGYGGVSYLFTDAYGLQQVPDPETADIIIWNGGEDIGTTLYNERPCSYGKFEMSQRDVDEVHLFEEFSGQSGKLLLGICRGAQLLNVLNGGKLWQDVNGHHRSHPMIDLRTGETLTVTSTHHQQMRIGETGVMIGVSSETSRREREGKIEHIKTTRKLDNGKDAEIVWYPSTNSLCVQGHPEYVPANRFAQYTYELLNEFFNRPVAKCAA